MSIHDAAPRILTASECEELGRRLLEMTDHPGAVTFYSSADASTTFARGRTRVPSENSSATVTLFVSIDGSLGSATTNSLSEAGLREAVAEAEGAAREHRTPRALEFLPPTSYPEGPPLYYDSLLTATGAEAQAELVELVTRETAAAGLVGAGDLHISAHSRATMNSRGMWAYENGSYGEFSLTARSEDGSGSGWAWSGYEDWGRVNVADVVRRAVALGRRSVNPVAIEPGRYPVILEPAAVASLIHPVLSQWPARWADAGATVFSGDVRGTNKIGMQMLDRRLGMVADPWDSERPGSVMTRAWTPIPEAVVWFENGVLQNLEYDRHYVEATGGDVVIDPGGVRLTAEGPEQTLEEMIASTRRGIWVNRLSSIATMNARTLLLSGTTRDGTFLIEDGQITRPIRNFRFTESPFFVLNRVEAAGSPVRASRTVVAPRLKLADFNFTSLTDAI